MKIKLFLSHSSIVLMILILVTSCKDKKHKIASGPEYTYKEWPYEIPARISDKNNSDLFLMALGKVETTITDGKYDPVQDAVTLNNGTVIPNWYKDSLGLEYYSPINKDIFPLPPSGMCTWYYYYQHINEEEVKLNARWLNENLLDYGAKYLQIDDGWQKEREDGGHGSRDWTGIDKAFPSGMDKLAAYIKEQGLIPGIWIAPHGQSKDSVVLQNPGVFMFKPDSTTASSTWEGKWLIDPTTEEAHKYLYDLFNIMAEWGYDYFKIDGQPIVVREYESKNEFMQSPGLDNEELFRSTLKTIRSAIGPERYLLGCWGLPVQGIGIMDGSRTGGDVILGWSGFDVALMPTMNYYYQHNIAWYTDPDVLMVRQPLTLPQAQTWATLQGLTGQALMTSDRFSDLSEERLDLIKKVYPAVDIRPIDLFPSTKRKTLWDLKINHLGRQYDVVGLFNFDEEKIKQHVLNFNEIGLKENVPYHVFDFWNNEYLGAWENASAFEVHPTSCRVLSVIPDNGKIRLVSTSRHITQGWVDLEDIKYDDQGKIYKGTSNVIANDPYQLHFAYPRGEYFEISSIKVKGAKNLKTKITNHQGWSTVKIESPKTTELEWSVTFKPAYSYKYETRYPGRISVEAIGIDAVKLSWGAQYYLNSGYQVYIDGKLEGYSPATYYVMDYLDPGRKYHADVQTVWKDGDISNAPDNNEQKSGITFTLSSLIPPEISMTDLKSAEGEPRYRWVAEVNGEQYPKSIGSTPGSASTYDINGLFKKLYVNVGLNDNARDNNNRDGLVFIVEGDGKILYRSRELKAGEGLLKIDIGVTGVQKIVLKTMSNSESSQRRWGPMGNWINPVLTK